MNATLSHTHIGQHLFWPFLSLLVTHQTVCQDLSWSQSPRPPCHCQAATEGTAGEDFLCHDGRSYRWDRDGLAGGSSNKLLWLWAENLQVNKYWFGRLMHKAWFCEILNTHLIDPKAWGGRKENSKTDCMLKRLELQKQKETPLPSLSRSPVGQFSFSTPIKRN